MISSRMYRQEPLVLHLPNDLSWGIMLVQSVVRSMRLLLGSGDWRM
jgi:hypothetical protein